jgi:hypothetical protein
MSIYSSSKAMPYVYICTHKVTKQFYIGYRCANLDHNRPSHLDLPKYKTSKKSIKQNFLEYNWVIVAEFFDTDSAYDFEQKLIFDHWGDPMLINESCYYSKPRFKSKALTAEHKQAISLAQSKPKTTEHRQKLSEANIGNRWYNNGNVSVQAKECPSGFVSGRLICGNEGFSSERARAAGLTNLGKTQKIITCPHCGKSGGNVLKRYHFDNCTDC